MAENGVRAGSLYYAVTVDRDAVQAAKDEAARIGKALSDILEKSASGFSKTIRDEFVAAGDAAEELGKKTEESAKGTGRAVDEATRKAREHVAELRRLANEQKAGTISQEQYRQKVAQLRAEMQQATAETTRGTQAYDLLQNALGRIATAETRDRLNAINNEVFASRNMLENGALKAGEFRERMKEIVAAAREMQEEMLRVEGPIARQSTEYRKLSNAIGGAERATAALDGHMTKLGMSRQLEIGALSALRRHFSDLGPAGNAAGLGIAAVVGGLNSLGKPLDLSVAGLHKLAGRLTAVIQALPLLATAATAGAIAGLVKMADSSVKLANDLDLASSSTGLGVEALQEWRYAAEQSGVSADTFTNLLTSLQRRLGSAANGNKSYAAAFAELGVEIKDANGNIRDLEDVLNDVAAGMRRVENETDRVRLATTIMNRSGAQLTAFFAQGSDAIREMRHQARELGLVISGDAVMSLVEYGNEIQNVRRQFETTKVEISAAFLPVLRDVLIPLVQDFFVPWMYNAAEQVVEFAESFTAVGPAGTHFRSEMFSNMEAVIEFGRVIAVVVQSALAAFNAVASVGGAVGGFIAGIADAEWVEDQRRVLEAQISFLEDSLRAENLAADARRSILSQLSDATEELELLPKNWWDAGVDGAVEGFQHFGERAKTSFEGVINTLNADIKGMLEEWMTHAFQGSDERGTVRTFGGDLGDDFAAGFLDGATSGLSGAAGKDDPLAAVRLWTRRLAYQLEQGLKTPISVLDILRPRLQDLITERDALFDAGGFGTEAWDVLEGKIKAVEAAMKGAAERLPALVGGPRPDEGEGGTWAEHLAEEHAARAARYAEIAERAGIGSVAGVAEANTLALQALETAMREEAAAWAAWQRARQATVVQPDEGASDTAFGRVYAKLADDLQEVNLRASVFGETASTVQQRIRLQEQVVLDLAREYGNLSPQVQFAKTELANLEQQLEDLNTTAEDTSESFGDKLQNALSTGLTWLTGHTQALGAAGQELDKLREQLATVMGTAPDAAERLRASLQALADEGGPAAAAAQQMLHTLEGWQAAEPDRVLDEYAEAMNTAALRAEVFGTEHELAGEQAELTARVIERLLPLLGAESSTVADLTERWRELREEQEQAASSANKLADRLGQISGSLRSIGGSGTGPMSDFVTGLGDAFSIAQQFATGDIAGGITAVISSIFSAITSVSEANRKAREELAKTEASFRAVNVGNFTRRERQKTGQFLFIPIYSNVTVPDESMHAIAGSIEDAFMSGLDNAKDVALAGGSLEEIEAAIEQGLMNAVVDGFWEGFLQTEAVKEKFGDDLARLATLAAAGDTEGAMRLIEGMRGSIKAFSADMATLLHGLGPTAAEQFEQAAGSIADSIQAGLESGLTRGVKSYLETGNLSDLTGALEGGVYDAIINSLTATLVEGALIQGALAGHIAEMSKAFAAGNTDLAVGIAEDMMKLIPQLAADIERVIAPFRSITPESSRSSTTRASRGGGVQVSEITGPTRDLLLTTLAPLANLDFLPSILTRTYELLDARLPHLGAAPAYAGAAAGAGGLSVSIGDIHISSGVIPPGTSPRGLVTSLGDEFGRALARELRGKGR